MTEVRDMSEIRKLVGIFSTDHTVRILLPVTAEDQAPAVRAQLAAWFSGGVVYRAAAEWTTEAGATEAGTLLVVETHGNDHQLGAHREELHNYVEGLRAQYGEEVVLDINNAASPVSLGRPQEVVQIYSTEQAAEYLGLSVASIKHHVHDVKDLYPVKVGSALTFTREELDRFRDTPRRGAGRPKAE
jgi:hypothetical protein